MRKVIIAVVFVAVMLCFSVAADKAKGREWTVDEFITELDEHQYYLPNEEVESLFARYEVTFPDGVAELGEEFHFNTAWSKDYAIDIGLDSDNWELLHPNHLQTVRTFLDDLILGRRLSQRLKDYDCKLEVITKKKSKHKEYIIKASSKTQDPQTMEFWVDDQWRITKTVLVSKKLKLDRLELGFRYNGKPGTWMTTMVLMQGLQAEPGNVLEDLRLIEIEHEEVDIDEDGINQVFFVSKIKMVADQKKEEGGHSYHFAIKLQPDYPQFIPICKSKQDMINYKGKTAVVIGELLLEQDGDKWAEYLQIKAQKLFLMDGTGNSSNQGAMKYRRIWQAITAKIGPEGLGEVSQVLEWTFESR